MREDGAGHVVDNEDATAEMCGLDELLLTFSKVYLSQSLTKTERHTDSVCLPRPFLFLQALCPSPLFWGGGGKNKHTEANVCKPVVECPSLLPL